MRRYLASLMMLAVAGTVAAAQDPVLRPEIRPFIGASIPTGPQRDLFENAAMYGVQAAMEVRESFHLVGSFGYVPGQTKYVALKENVRIMQYDVGFEANMVRAMGRDWLFKPFLGLGAGLRTYLYDDDDLKNRTCGAGYGTLGTEFQLGRTAIRFEGRDNLFCFKSPLPDVKQRTRNDVGLSVGLAYHIR